MLKYNIKLTDNGIRQEELVWSEKYLAPDLSFVSGVTSQNYHLEKFSRLPLTNSLVNNNKSTVAVESENVTRQGYIIISGKTYDVNSGSVVDYSVESSGTPINYKYLLLNGKYYYSYNNESFTIKNWLVGDEYGNVTEKDINVNISQANDGSYFIKLDTVAWIEDGIVNIDGYDYFFERDIQTSLNSNGCLKYYEDGDCLESSSITKCDCIICYTYKSSNDYLEVTKFKLIKEEEVNEKFDKISFCKYFFYVKYKDYYLTIKLNDSKFVCEIPNYVLGKVDDSEYYETKEFPVYQVNGESNVLNETQITGDTFYDLLSYSEDVPCVVIEDSIFLVEHDIMNSNDGTSIAIYLDDYATNFSIGDRIRFVDTESSENRQIVYFVSNEEYKFNNNSDSNFVLFNNKKYKVENDICDKVSINNVEYSIEYNNGKTEGKDCLVVIGDEKLPMKIIKKDNKLKLERYGRIISGNSNSAITAVYDIVPYSGITVNNKKYIIKEDAENSEEYYAYLDKQNEYTFIIEEINGSSMVVCSPYINATDFTKEFNISISHEICNDVVTNQAKMLLYTKNKVFGDSEITQELAFQNMQNPTSSDDYYDLFVHLTVFVKSGYIHIPLLFSNSQGNNTIQDDIVENRFFEEVKRNAINPIVDMEKDVYYPKYISNSDNSIKAYKDSLPEGSEKPSDSELKNAYIGSYTDFYPIKQITVNPHFRTRDLDSWKVNEGYNDISISGNADNWFVTDFHPYKDMPQTSAETLINTSDLVGLLNFKNDDVFYQKSKIAKSFLRFSYYDSINLQTQSLLATSCVFMDEHRMFKRFIDNSRKNVYDFGYISKPTETVGVMANKIAVNTEFLGSMRDNIKKAIMYDQFKDVIIDSNHRIGSEFIINNKYETDTSSEGYYIYIFREYSENLAPKPIYMKVEFNHAGIGRTIPFIIPMRWSNTVDKSGYKTPVSALTLSTGSTSPDVLSDMELLKQGVNLSDVYAQTYIPLYAVYDFKNKEYAYVFDSRYIEVKDDSVNINLFELKIKNEDTLNDAQHDAQQRAVTLKNQESAIINMNEAQFRVEDKICG